MCKILGVGTDMTAVSRFEKQLEKARFMERIYTEGERAYIGQKGQNAAQSAAAMFAAKEAAVKALGIGFAGGVTPAQIEVTHDEHGAPGLIFHGAAKARLETVGAKHAHLSLSHEGDMALAFAVIEG